jgi:hypothetical protein
VPDNDTLTRALGDIAETGRRASLPAPASEIRSLAGRRRRRHVATIGALTVAALVVTASSGVLDSGPDRNTEADGGPTATATTSGAKDLPAAAFGPATLLSEDDVASSLGSMGSWTAGDIEEPDGPGTPCQADDAADPDRSAALSRVVTGGWSGDDTLTELVEETSDGKAAFQRAVGWFTACGGEGVDQSDTKGSLTKRFGAMEPLPGADEQAVVVRRRAHLGGETWTNTVAGIIRVDNLLAVIAWDVTIDDDPGAYDDGFLDLMRVAVGRLTDHPAPRVDPEALVHADDPTAVAVAGEGAEARQSADQQMQVTTALCGDGDPYLPAALLASRQVHVIEPEALPASIGQGTYLFASRGDAARAMRESRVTPESCPDNEDISELSFSGGDESYVLRSPAVEEGAETSSVLAVVRVGSTVSVVSIRELNGTVSDEAALDLIGSVTDRLQRAYG